MVLTAEKLIKRIINAKTPYRVLGLKRNCTMQDIRKAYLEISLIIHPDKCQLDGAIDCFQRVNEAHKLLKDRERRQRYDEGNFKEWMYHPKLSDEDIDSTPEFKDGPIPSMHANEDDISPEEVIGVFFGDINKIRNIFNNRKFFSGKMKRKDNFTEEEDFDDNEEEDDNKNSKENGFFKSNRFYHSLCFALPFCIFLVFLF